MYLGSPPRVREERYGIREGVYVEGITPACAGRTRPLPYLQFLNQDHPRVCGKNGDACVGGNARIGSPPRVREELKPYLPL